MTARWVVPAVLAVCIAAALDAPGASATEATEATRSPPDEARFPHARHARMFPNCIGCHGGVLASDTGSTPLMGADGAGKYPTPAQCSGCHDGVDAKAVTWAGPAREPSNLRFTHARHNREADLGDAELNCGRCHRQSGATIAMAVAEAVPETCIACHDHRAPSHLADEARCRTCHVPVARAVALAASRIHAFPRPPTHERSDFAGNHAVPIAATEGRCAVCHARQSCERCHANGARVRQIAALERDSRIATLVAGLAPSYAAPRSHLRADFSYAHGREARTRIATCANCHTQPGCRSCHTGHLAADAIATLPPADSVRGVRLRARVETSDGDVLLQGVAADTGGRVVVRGDTGRRVAAHPPGFSTRHGPAAAAGRSSCAGCHEPRRFCAQCHDGEAPRRFHPRNFVQRHAPEAYARPRECSACHSREGFCASCHQQAGVASRGRRDVAYHTAQGTWLIQHGRAARQGLASCTTCHVQRDCMQCHSVAGWSVDPHGPGFNASRMAARNAQTCRTCHLGDPFRARP